MKDELEMFLPSTKMEKPSDFVALSFGRWLVNEPLYKLDKTWAKLKNEMEAGKLTTTGLKSSTGRYNPSSAGPGPVTTGVISVYTTEENRDVAGDEVIHIVKHDIQYKPKSADERRRIQGDRGIISKHLFWNSGKPSETRVVKGYIPVWSQNIKDKWHKNIAKSPDFSENISGHWCAESKLEDLTTLWHTLKDQIESGSLGPVKMICPGQGVRRRKERTTIKSPQLLLYTTPETDKDCVGLALERTGLVCSLNYIITKRKASEKLDEKMKNPSIDS